jgi:hypothetical protein
MGKLIRFRTNAQSVIDEVQEIETAEGFDSLIVIGIVGGGEELTIATPNVTEEQAAIAVLRTLYRITLPMVFDTDHE